MGKMKYFACRKCGMMHKTKIYAEMCCMKSFDNLCEEVSKDNEVDCVYYVENPLDFNGCPGLDVKGDPYECGDCFYRLGNVCRALNCIQIWLTQKVK